MELLEKIIDNKRREVAALKRTAGVFNPEKNSSFSRETISLKKSLTDPLRNGIIAEFKRKSPSKGVINHEADAGEVTVGYSEAGASGLSVLTDNKFFGGSLGDLQLIRRLNTIPVLRKDFIIDEFQVLESKAAGADVILLIAAVIGPDQILKLSSLAHSLRMEVILEIHSIQELETVNENIDIIGINNRDLRTFVVDTDLSFVLAEKIPGQFLKISESGISSPVMVKRLKEAGYNGFLIGELFMSGKDPVSMFSDFVKQI